MIANQLANNIETILIYALASSIGALLIWVGRSLAKLAQNQSAIHDQVMGVPEVGYPSMRDQFTEVRNHLCKQDETLNKLEHEVQDNSGSSLKDAVKLVNRDVTKNTVMLNSLNKKIDEIDNRLSKHIDSIESNKV